MSGDPFFGDEPEERPTRDPLWVPPESRDKPGTAVQPVEVWKRRAHPFKKKPEGKRGCALCGAAKTAWEHWGTPESLNVFGSGANRFKYQGLKKMWEEWIVRALTAAALPKPIGSVYAEAQMCFGDRRARDQGNYRFILEKALGDALQLGGWLENDDWSRYEFGNIALKYRKGECWTKILIMPAWPAEEAALTEEPPPGQGTLTTDSGG